MRKFAMIATVAMTALATLGVFQTAASATDGETTRTKSFSNLSIKDDAGHVIVKISSASITWRNNSIDKTEGVTIKARFKDARSDGKCASVQLATMVYDEIDPGGSFPYVDQGTTYKECNGTYVTKSKYYNTKGRHCNRASINSNYYSYSYNKPWH
jgi:hypothetical protein